MSGLAAARGGVLARGKGASVRARVRRARLRLLGPRLRLALRRVRAARRAAPAARRARCWRAAAHARLASVRVAVAARCGGFQCSLWNNESKRLGDGVEQEMTLPYQRPGGR